MENTILGIDIGGSGIKGAPVNIKTGELIKPRLRIPTPAYANPEQTSEVINEIVKHFKWKGLAGCGFPGVIINNKVFTATNFDKSWIGKNISQLLFDKTGCRFHTINDADAAAEAMIEFDTIKNNTGTVLVITVGTGIGTALFHNGILVPNLELGHIEIKGIIAEDYASDAIRKKEDLSWKKWGKRFNKYLKKMENLIWPEVIILGGGISKKFENFKKYIDINTKIIPATLQNEAGIIGAALSASKFHNKK